MLNFQNAGDAIQVCKCKSGYAVSIGPLGEMLDGTLIEDSYVFTERGEVLRFLHDIMLESEVHEATITLDSVS